MALTFLSKYPQNHYTDDTEITVLRFVALLFGNPVLQKYLDVVPKEVVTEKDVYSTIVTAERAWADLYNTLGTSSTNITGGINVSACTDECKNHWENVVELNFNSGAWGTTNNALGNWESAYQSIRRINIFLKNIDNVPIPADRKDYYQIRLPQYKAEVRF
ncbi:hypothetical protein [Paraflavitalea speifideaquila]|uniref:hypothetical protein n=1 Tax=Paraflavitalea speifideaquila TaxID=3076558 RepID=UPI0028EE1EEC|nr:hypothetical protein [Paraflavitalea speifideiaquila]